MTARAVGVTERAVGVTERAVGVTERMRRGRSGTRHDLVRWLAAFHPPPHPWKGGGMNWGKGGWWLGGGLGEIPAASAGMLLYATVKR